MAADSTGESGDDVMSQVVGLLEQITSDWDVGRISADSRLADLNLESINLVYLIAELQQKYGLQQYLFTRIRTAGLPLAELRVGDIAEFIRKIRGTGEAPCEEASS